MAAAMRGGHAAHRLSSSGPIPMMANKTHRDQCPERQIVLMGMTSFALPR